MRVAVFGLGLIGGSVALALAEAGHEVVGCDANTATHEAARERIEVVDDARDLADSEVAVLALPMAVLTSVSRHNRFKTDTYPGILTDVASVKGTVERRYGSLPRFVGGHPMAGKETSGWSAAEPGLFRGSKWALCLEEHTSLEDWTTLARLWTSIGAHVVPTTAEAHDRAVAKVSHIEHIVAAALTLNAADPLSRTLAAGSFRDGTRVAASPTRLVEGMVEGNQTQLLNAFTGLQLQLSRAMQSMSLPPEQVAEWYEPARRLRTAWPPRPGEPESIQLTRENLLDLGEAGGWVESVAGNDVATIRRPRVQSTS